MCVCQQANKPFFNSGVATLKCKQVNNNLIVVGKKWISTLLFIQLLAPFLVSSAGTVGINSNFYFKYSIKDIYMHSNN